jgi:hypothetical protein
LCQFLLERGADANAALPDTGETPPTWASWHRRSGEVLQMLCYGPHRISDAGVTHYSGDRGRGWGGLDRSLLGKPS